MKFPVQCEAPTCVVQVQAFTMSNQFCEIRFQLTSWWWVWSCPKPPWCLALAVTCPTRTKNMRLYESHNTWHEPCRPGQSLAGMTPVFAISLMPEVGMKGFAKGVPCPNWELNPRLPYQSQWCYPLSIPISMEPDNASHCNWSLLSCSVTQEAQLTPTAFSCEPLPATG